MKNKIITLILVTLTIISFSITAYCNNLAKEYKSELSQNEIHFNVDLEKGIIDVEANYLKNDFVGKEFLLNRDFTVTKIICDGIEVKPEEMKELIKIDGDYSVNLYQLPQYEKELKIEYTGYLSGGTGSSPYVREKISKDFTFLRFETYCYPIFASDWESILQFLYSPLQAEITINVPKGYSALTPFELLKKIENVNGTSFVYTGDIANFSCAIAKYNKLKLPSGDYYFLENMDIEKLTDFITPIMDETQKYMNLHFGESEIATDMRYIVIPEKFGSFAIPGKAIYIESSSFKSTFDMNQLIHEFIHLGWNALPEDGEIQRARFFDEGFTSYFQARVVGELLGEEIYESQIKRCEERYKSIVTDDNEMFIPIVDYGKYEYGGLSYYAGPIFFDKLCELVGVDKFDKATTEFLKKYKNTAVDFDTMCKEYIRLCENAELEEFFQDWLYTTKGYEQYIN